MTQSIPQRLMDLCLQTIIKSFEKKKYVFKPTAFHDLPDELTIKLIELLNKRRKLTDSTIAHFIHPNLRTLDFINCHNINMVAVRVSSSFPLLLIVK